MTQRYHNNATDYFREILIEKESFRILSFEWIKKEYYIDKWSIYAV